MQKTMRSYSTLVVQSAVRSASRVIREVFFRTPSVASAGAHRTSGRARTNRKVKSHMRIGVLVPRRTSQGGSYFVDTLVAAAEEIDDTVSFIRIEMGAPTGAGWRSVGVSSWAFGEPIDLVLRRLEVDILFCPGSFVPATTIPTVFWPLTVGPIELADEPEDSPWGAIGKKAIGLALKRSVARADAFVFSSDHARRLYFGRFPSEGRSYIRIHPVRPEVEQSWHPGDQPTLLTASRFNRYKRLPTIIRALAHLEFDHHVTLRVAGAIKDDVRAEVEEAIGSLGADRSVELLGQISRDDLYREYGKAWAFVFGSLTENGSSYALIDAMAHGVPVISTSDSSMPEISGHAARYATPFSAEALAHEIDEILADPDERRQRSAAGLVQAQLLPTRTEVAELAIGFFRAFLAQAELVAER